MYKDPDKQREANAERQRRYRAERGLKAYPGRDTKGVTNQGVTVNGSGACVTPKEGYIGAVPCAPPILEQKVKRGKDIKCFDDLPVDVKLIINRLSDSNEEKQRRTAVAINYQHQFPDRYHSTGVA